MTKVHANSLQGGKLLIRQTVGQGEGHGEGETELEGEQKCAETSRAGVLSVRG